MIIKILQVRSTSKVFEKKAKGHTWDIQTQTQIYSDKAKPKPKRLKDKQQ